MELRSMKTLLPFVGMVLVILAQVSNMIVTKEAMCIGVNKYVMVVYCNVLSSFIFLLASLIIHRFEHAPMTTAVVCKIFLISVFGWLSVTLSFVGIDYSSPTLNTAMLNLIPAFTFILATIFRMEKLNWRSISSQAKSLGTTVSIAGAFVVTFYNGPPIIKKLSASNLPHQLLPPQSSWVLGGFILAAEAFFVSAMYVLQALVLKEFPALLIFLLYSNISLTVLAAIFSVFVVTDPSAWKLRPDFGLFPVVYSAVIGITFPISLLLWCLKRTGPLYVSMFKPLAILFSTVMSVIFLGDALYLGSLIGGVIIVAGFYAVMWGKFKEEKVIEDCESSSKKVPLLQNMVEEINSNSSGQIFA